MPKIASCLTILFRLSSFSFVAFPRHIKSFCLETHTSREATGRQSETLAAAKSDRKSTNMEKICSLGHFLLPTKEPSEYA